MLDAGDVWLANHPVEGSVLALLILLCVLAILLLATAVKALDVLRAVSERLDTISSQLEDAERNRDLAELDRRLRT
jgi:F0F1-type ATP synthase membrane subunit b/b'